MKSLLVVSPPPDDESDYEPDSGTESPTELEMSMLKRKGFQANPIRTRCKIQFDEDDNPEGCCKSHTGKLSFYFNYSRVDDCCVGALTGDFSHEYSWDCDDPEWEVYDGETSPEAWYWTCCANEVGGAEARTCWSGKHAARYESRPRCERRSSTYLSIYHCIYAHEKCSMCR